MYKFQEILASNNKNAIQKFVNEIENPLADTDGYIPIIEMAKHHKAFVYVGQLIDKTFDFSIKDSQGNKVIDLLLSILINSPTQNSCLKLIETLLKKGADANATFIPNMNGMGAPIKPMTDTCQVVQKGDVEVLKLLIKYKVNLNKASNNQ